MLTNRTLWYSENKYYINELKYSTFHFLKMLHLLSLVSFDQV